MFGRIGRRRSGCYRGRSGHRRFADLIRAKIPVTIPVAAEKNFHTGIRLYDDRLGGLVSRTKPVRESEEGAVDGNGELGVSPPQPKATNMRIRSDWR